MDDPKVLKTIKERDQSGQRIAAICAAPTVFLKAGIADERKLTSYPSEEDKFKNSKYSESSVVNDGNMITSRGVGTAIDFALAIVTELEGNDIAEGVAKKILHKSSLS
jgi:4-methyl-5(b-hydroxyethyl)-thiazole monophosphate biosynthesis